MSFDQQAIEQRAARMRADILKMVTLAGSGHPGGSLSSTDIMATLYFGDVLRYRPEEPKWDGRDRFILSKGHVAPVLYAALANAGCFDVTELAALRKFNSRLQGHPDHLKLPAVEVSTGSLGQGLSIAAGIAYGLRACEQTEQKVYVLLGDGELQEGQNWEAAMFAAHQRLDNLIAIVDNNGLQIDGRLEDVVSLGSIADKFSSFGFTVFEVDGHDVAELKDAFNRAVEVQGTPVVIIAKTIKGKGVSFMENQAGWHGKAPSDELCDTALKELGTSMSEEVRR
ncbi:MAG TPA: transketolase [Coriobacteriia bacterium]|nr:transketolase [Coriobacteriia bacterium]